ncbi:hypothetical protein JQ637_42350 [Bradyrhizobium diazoefficiens]|nr:hypothetical protein [Bradyrhizobium diazoefficiens]
MTPSQLIEQVGDPKEGCSVSCDPNNQLRRLYMTGLIEEDLDDCFIWQTGDWTTLSGAGCRA